MVDLKAQLDRIRPELEAAIGRVLATSHFVGGEECELFEQEFAAYCGTTHACGVANGTDALTLALRAYGVGPGDEVVTAASTFIGTGEAILLNGARPVFVDVDPQTFTMDASQVERALSARTKVILPVHLYGHPADMSALNGIARRRGLPVLEDAAQAHGAEVDGRRAGSLGHSACFSFYPGKMVTSSDGGFIARVRQLANHGGGSHKYDNVVLGTNSRLDALQAAVLRVKLRHLDGWNQERRERVEAYTEALAGLPSVLLPRERAGARSAWHLFTIRTNPRDGLKAHLQSQGIGVAVHYPRPIHLQPAMAAAGGRPGDHPVSEALSREVLSLPLYPELPKPEARRIADEVRSFCTATVRG
jgi:dTDP-4-amino-4,6-dideoxygalactose transaminase